MREKVWREGENFKFQKFSNSYTNSDNEESDWIKVGKNARGKRIYTKEGNTNLDHHQNEYMMNFNSNHGSSTYADVVRGKTKTPGNRYTNSPTIFVLNLPLMATSRDIWDFFWV